MSASNWATCPRCFDEANRTHAEVLAAADALYGTVPIAEYEAARVALAPPPSRDAFETFRENYEFYGAESGTVVASYGGECSKCGLSVSLDASEKFWPVAEGSK